MTEINAYVIDANRLSREGLIAILSRGDLTVAKEASTLDELRTQGSEDAEPNLILIDCGHDPEVARRNLDQLRGWYPTSKIVVLSASEDPTFLVACFSAPIDGLVSKNVSSSALLKSLHLVMAGERVFPSQLVTMLLAGGASAAVSSPKLQAGSPSLSERETQILQCLVAGDSNKAIANRLHVTEATVKVHLKSILRKIQVRNRTQAAIWALNRGMNAGEINIDPKNLSTDHGQTLR
ncbi:LuxR C-terminal-related transcriptional regulator [Rhodovibrio salinarum]|uniref:DNA-binding response regulator n=1 Tax=Rhodovibrio salinarum TaxID=1087 RepID=A0A934QG89_9PROT|nr:response regulator transcription factor [Rhodovibrio salinarum]MBK1696421.1 DNA-binding response regulator [Rhodovibrio salinarum]